MRSIGLIGGMSWESSVTYYQTINQVVKKQLGGLHSAKCILYSVDFQEIEECQKQGRWKDSAAILGQAAIALERAGAEFFLICTNTMHKVAQDVQKKVSIPLLHIADATADVLVNQAIDTVALLGTAYTMEQDFYKQRLRERGISVVIPDSEARAEINRIIYEELCLGKILPSSKKFFIQAIKEITKSGSQGTILGCTEIGLLIGKEDVDVPVFDTAQIHAEAAAFFSLNRKNQQH